MELRRKSTNQRSSKARDKFSALRDLRNNNLTTSEYLKEREDNERIYDEVDEEEYENHQRQQQEDDFVVEDGVGGYSINTKENESDGYSSESDLDTKGKNIKKKKPAEKKDEQLKNPKLNSFFKNIQNKGPKKSENGKKDSTLENQFMESLFQDLDKGPSTSTKRKAQFSHSSKPRSKIEKSKKITINPRAPDENDIKRIKMEYETENTQEIQPKNFSTDKEFNQDFDFTLTEEDMDLNPGLNDYPLQLEVKPDLIPKTEPEEQFDDLLIDEDENMIDWMSLQGGLASEPVNASMESDYRDNNFSQTSFSKSESLDSNDSESFDMFWLDALENKGSIYLFGKTLAKSSNEYISTCVVINGLERNLFVLPRSKPSEGDSNENSERFSTGDVHSEISNLLLKCGVKEFACKPVVRKYSFEDPSVPESAEYLKVVYDFKLPSIPLDTFGLSWCKRELVVESPKSIYILSDAERLQKSYPNVPPLSILSLSAKTIVNTEKNTNEIVSLSLLSVKKYEIENTQELLPENYELTTIVRQLEGVPFPIDFENLATQGTQKARESRGGQNIIVSKSERELLLNLINSCKKSDPDIIIGHNFLGFLLDVLLHRMKLSKIEDWSQLGRMKRKFFPKLQSGLAGMGESSFSEKQIMAGRLVCDSYLTSKDLVRAKSYSLGSLAQSELQIRRDEFPPEQVINAFNNTRSPHPLLLLCRHTSFDAYLCITLVHRLQAIPLTKQLTNLAGNLWSRTMSGARAERNEFLLLHEFYNLKFIRPDKAAYVNPEKMRGSNRASSNKKPSSAHGIDDETLNNTAYDSENSDNEISRPVASSASLSTRAKRKPAYSGGLVLEPKKGLYEQYVLLLDFNSLYPSIIQEFNICFTTVIRADDDEIPQDPDPSLPMGLLPKLLKNLVDKRKQVKSLLKKPNLNEKAKNAYDLRQKALKLTANSMYGCLGFTNSRFYAKSLAALITSKGRKILLDTQSLAEQQGLEVLYGDTDSIMINTASNDLNNAYEVGSRFKKQVNDLYKLLELDIDGVYRRLLLLKKKKYAALIVTGPPIAASAKTSPNNEPSKEEIERVPTKLETRGLDMVRRDWCEISHEISGFVLNKILSGLDSDLISSTIYNHLETVARFVRSGKAPLNKFVINKGLSKSPDSYSESQTLPHVAVAIRMKKSGHSIKAGDTVPYIIGIKNTQGADLNVNDSGPNDSSSHLSERGFHVDEVRSSHGKIEIDPEWYLAQQILPPIVRLCEPIHYISASRLATSLGLDASKYGKVYDSKSGSDYRDELKTFDSQISDSERFKEAEPFEVICYSCGSTYSVDGIATKKENNIVSGIVCSCNATPISSNIVTQLTLAIRKQITKFQMSDFECGEPGCNHRTKNVNLNFTFVNGINVGPRCPRFDVGCGGTLHRIYTERKLYNQLLYFSSLFDIKKNKERILKVDKKNVSKNAKDEASSGDNQELLIDRIFNMNHEIILSCDSSVNSYLECSSFRFVDLGTLFKTLKLL
ncbi:DNA polymerase alpha catalytic subunit [Smittium mucronatum]|uniref:DNA polymerase n=1 Tax=Smittium mucronatum TaxID=133383 RepID=A0A1R0GX12_9FUNG|nr:DNA polymerase alpha catalytic subunit [Smittium mucronatum]